MRIFILPFLLFVLIPIELFCQEVGFPFIRNYEPKEFNANPLNWCIIQDNRGVMFFGNRQGVLEYDGVNWHLIQLPKKSAVRSLNIDRNGIIFVGGSVEFGYLSPDKTGKLFYKSLLPLLNEKESKISNILQILSVNDSIIFKSNYKLYILYKNKFKIINSEKKLLYMFAIDNELFFRIPTKGLTKLKNQEFESVLSEDQIKIEFTTHLNLSNNVLLLPSRDKPEIIQLDLNKLQKQPEQCLKPFLLNFKINYPEEFYTSTKIDANRFLVTGRESSYLIDNTGNLIFHLDKNSGFRKPFIYNVFCDKNKSIWFALENGIARVESEQSVTMHHPASKFDLHVTAMQRYNGKLFLASLTGFYYFNNNTIFPIENEGKTWDLINFTPENSNDTLLLLARDNGINVFKQGKINLLVPTASTALKFFQSKIDKNRLYVGLYSGVISLYFKDNKLSLEKTYDGIKDNIKSIYEETNGNIWLGTTYNGFIHLTNKGNTDIPQIINIYNENNGVLSNKNCKIFDLNNQPIFACDKGLMKFKSGCFIPDSSFGSQFCDGKRDVSIFRFIKNNSYFISGENNKKSEPGILSIDENGLTNWNTAPFKVIAEMMVDNVFFEKNKIWICGTEGVFCYQMNKEYNYNDTFNILIRQVSTNQDSIIFNGTFYYEIDTTKLFTNKQLQSFIPKFSYSDNNIQFQFAAIHYSNESENQYQYILEGYDKNWSEWSTKPFKEYTNLQEKTYKFKVRAKNSFGTLSNIATYEFVVLPPWYRTIWAYFLYFSFLVIVITFIAKMNAKRLQLANIKLENKIRERTDEIMQQNAEIQAQAEELEKLTLAVSKTDNAIVIMDANGNFEWVNKGFTQLYGLTFEEFIDKRGTNILECSSNPQIKEQLNQCINEKKTVYYDFFYHKEDGKKVWAQTTITPILDVNNNVVKLVAIDSDITKLKLAEEEIQQQNIAIQEQTAHIEEINQNLEIKIKEEVAKNRQKDLILNMQSRHAVMGEMIGNIAHQWRQPLNAVGIIIQNLEEAQEFGELDEKYLKDKVQKAMNLINFMSQTINDFRNFFKPDKEKTKFSINNAIQRTLSFVEANLKNSNINLSFANEHEIFTYGFPNEYGQVVINIINNAKDVLLEKKTPEAWIKINLSQYENMAKLTIADNAGGIPDNIIHKIFDPYFTTKTDEKGTGLGLYICKTIVEKNMNGRISVSNDANGAVFEILLPIIAV